MKRKPSNLSESLHRQLNAYALAASAAGVGVLALTQPAEGKIIYTEAHVVIRSASRDQYILDVNHDGVADFWFNASNWATKTSTSFAYMKFGRAPREYSNQVRGHRPFDSALRKGVRVGSGTSFNSRNGLMAHANSDLRNHPWFSGDWANSGKGVKGRYLGLKFYIKGKPHYGWARANVKVSTFPVNFTVTLTGYAYETIPNKAIIAGKTRGPDVITIHDAGLGHLARGADAIPAWRGKE
jgi:hypothetical protein